MFTRFVALGDSQTEGLMDGDEARGYRGWADRLATMLAAVEPSLAYANLAVRGQLAHQVNATQLGPALALAPDLASVMAGVNDMLRRRFDVDSVAGHLEAMFAALTATGATVLTVTYPDPARLVPAARMISARTAALNDRIRAAAVAHGVVVMDLGAHDVCVDPRLWSADRLHLNELGHARMAAGAAYALGLPGSSAAWADPLERLAAPTFWGRTRAELAWTRSFAGPWLVRRLRGRSSGDGRAAKRPALGPVDLTG